MRYITLIDYILHKSGKLLLQHITNTATSIDTC